MSKENGYFNLSRVCGNCTHLNIRKETFSPCVIMGEKCAQGSLFDRVQWQKDLMTKDRL
jgi:hypothetical protein